MAPRKPPVAPVEPVTPVESVTPTESVTPVEGEITVKHRTNGKTFKVSQKYYQLNKHKLDVA